MRTNLLLLNDRYGDANIPEEYVLHFAEWFTDLGYRITLGYGDKTDPQFCSPVIFEFQTPALSRKSSPPPRWEVRKLAALAVSAVPALVFVQYPLQPIVLEALREVLPGIPLLLYAHDRLFGPTAELDWNSVHAPLLQEEGAAGYDAVLVNHATHRRHLVRGLGLPVQKVHVAPGNFTAGAPLSPLEPQAQGTILFAGDIHEEAGVVELIAASARIRHPAPWRLRIAGRVVSRAYLDHCRRLAEEEAFREGVEITFWPDPPPLEMESLYREATVLALPRLCAASFPVEAQVGMEHGLPVVAFDLGEVGLLVKEQKIGLLALPGDIRCLAGKLEWALKHPDEIRRMGRLARSKSAWLFHAREHVSVLNRLIENLIEAGSPVGPGTISSASSSAASSLSAISVAQLG